MIGSSVKSQTQRKKRKSPEPEEHAAARENGLRLKELIRQLRAPFELRESDVFKSVLSALLFKTLDLA